MDSLGHQRAETTTNQSGLEGVETGTFLGEGGVRLVWHRTGNPSGPALVLANGIGGNLTAWEHLVRHFRDRALVLSWDYRGLFGSEKPGHPDGYGIPHHAADLVALLDHHHVREAVILGWSMGAQVGFEALRVHAQRVRGMVVINGTSGLPFQSAFHTAMLDEIIPKFSGLFARHWRKAAFIAPHLGRSRMLFAMMKAVGVLGHTADEGVFRRLAQEYATLDFGAWMEIFVRLGAHDASDVLPSVRCPTLILAGERDLFTPLPVARLMAERIPGAELYVVNGGTHYCPLEFPELVSLRVEKFLVERTGLPGF
jgi:pimeloyl-ACP methyl ester carboxylesterase